MHSKIKTLCITLGVLFVSLIFVTQLYAGKRYAVASSDWNQTSTWSTTPGGSGGAPVPTSSDTVYIEANGRTVTIPNNYTAYCHRLEIGTSTNANSCYLNFGGSGATLNVGQDVIIYGGNSSFIRRIDVASGILNINGNLTLNLNGSGDQSNRNCVVQISTGTVNLSGNLNFNSPSSGASPEQNQINITGAGNFYLGGNFNIQYNLGTISPGTSSNFIFNGSINQTVPIGVSNIRYNNLHFSNTGTKTISAAITTSNVTGDVRIYGGTLSNNSYTITGNSTKTFQVANGAKFLMLGTTGMVTGFQTKTFGTTSTVEYGGGNQTVSNEGYGHLILSGSGTKTMPTSEMILAGDFTMAGTSSATAGASITVNGNFTLGAGTTFNAGSYTHNIKGNFINNGATFTASTSTINLNGSSAQTIAGTTSTTFANLTINNSSGITVNKSAFVNGVLTLTNGIVATGNETLAIGSTGSVSRVSGHIWGNFKKYVSTGSSVSRTFEIGTSYYSPVTVTFASVNTAGNLTARAIDGDHPNIANSGINSSKSVNRHWILTNSGIGFTTYNAVFNFNPLDIDAGADPNNFYVAKKDGSSWSFPEIGTRTNTSTQALAMSSFSDFQIGEKEAYTLTINITGNGTVTKNPDQATYTYGTWVKLQANPDPGWSFGGYSGDLTSSNAYDSILMTGNKTVNALFTQDQYTLTINYAGSGTGSVSKNPNQATYTYGTWVYLTANPDANCHFAGYTGDLIGSNAYDSILMNSSKTITATFNLDTFLLTINITGNGSVNKVPNQTYYNYGTWVKLQTNP
ncbi:MAG: hypothetical protein N2201_05835, partial [candidate division WOR-3 bacterium]|nr:hypothetical protein [candidate division WOR-3 bacterium]